MFDHLQFVQGQCTESAAQVFLRPHADAEIQSFSASLYGPSCKYSRTLAADFAFRDDEPLQQSALVTEPCYWTSALPFLYDLKTTLQMNDGKVVEQTAQVGLRRWNCEGTNFRLEGKRIVLRGAKPTSEVDNLLTSARASEVALLVSPPADTTLATANQTGVPLIIDLRNASNEIDAEIDRLPWSPAVMAVILDADQVRDKPAFAKPRSGELPLGLTVNPKSQEQEYLHLDFDFYAIENSSDERPPSWLANVDTPVIAIRRGGSYADFTEARAACDRLQAELAPEFDLAGYFVAP